MMVIMDILKTLHGIFIAIAVVIVTAGVILSVGNLLMMFIKPKQAQELYHKARWILCQYIVFGLEFMIAGDVVHTLLMPDYHTTLMLGAMVLIRTVLSYFINLEMSLMENGAAAPRGCRCQKKCSASCS